MYSVLYRRKLDLDPVTTRQHYGVKMKITFGFYVFSVLRLLLLLLSFFFRFFFVLPIDFVINVAVVVVVVASVAPRRLSHNASWLRA